MSAVLLALAPDAGLIAVGAYLQRSLPVQGWAQIDKLNANLLFPALIFHAASGRSCSLADLTAVGVGVWAVILLGCGGAFLLRPWGPRTFLDFAGLWQTAWRFNAAIALVAVQALPAEVASLMSIAIGCAVPLANLLAVSALSRGKAIPLGQTVLLVATNPFLLASVSGVALSMSGWMMPNVLSSVVDRLAQAAVPLALLSIGAALDLRALVQMDICKAGLNAIKLMVLPCATAVIGYGLQLPPTIAAVLIVFAALPTASAAHVLASSFGADRSIVANLIAQSTLLSCLSLPMWISLAAFVAQHGLP